MFGRRKTVEDIVAPISRIVTELKTHAESHHDKAGGHLTEADRHKILAQAARNEGEKADTTASKIAGLLA